MHVAAHGPKEVIGLLKQTPFMAREHAEPNKIVRIADMVVVFCDPEEGLQVAQAALAFLYIGLDEITTVASLAVALVAFGKLGGDEFGSGAGRHFLVEAVLEFRHQRLVAADMARFEDGRANGHVRFR